MAKKNLTLEEKLEEAIVKDGAYEIPGNWVWSKLGLVCQLSNGFAFKSTNYKETGIPIIRISNIQESGVVIDEKTVYSDKDELLNKYRINKNDLLIAMSGATTGKIGVFNENIIAYLNQRVGNIKITQPDLILDKYRNYLISYKSKDILDLAYGGAQPNISSSMIEGLSIPLPPLKEQQRIVDRIEGLFEKLDKAKELIEEAREGFENRKISVLEKAFTGGLTESFRKTKTLSSIKTHLEVVRIKRIKRFEENVKIAKESGLSKPKKDYDFIIEDDCELPNGWVRAKLDQLIYMAGRIGWKGLKASEYTDEGPMFLSVYNLNYGDDVVYDKVYHISSERYEESPEIKVKVNDILLTKDGAGIGKIGFVKELPNEATINSSLLIIRAEDVVLSKYLFYFFMGPKLQGLVKERITGSAIPHLFQRDIKEFSLSIPPIEEQEEIVRILDKFFDEENKVKELTQLEEQIELIKKSILAKAFRGKLGTNCGEDGNALDLLEKIL